MSAEDGGGGTTKPPKMKKWEPAPAIDQRTGGFLPAELPKGYEEIKTKQLVKILAYYYSNLHFYWNKEQAEHDEYWEQRNRPLNERGESWRQERIRLVTERIEKVRTVLRTKKPEKVQKAMEECNVPSIALTGGGSPE